MPSPELAEEVLDDVELLRARDPRGLLPAVAGAGPQVRETARLTEAYGRVEGVGFDELDGLTVSLPDGAWFNLRASNTEPLLRLNVEAPDQARMEQVRDDVLALIRAA